MCSGGMYPLCGWGSGSCLYCTRHCNIGLAEAEERAANARDLATDLEEKVRRLEASVASMQAELAQKEEDLILVRESAGAEADGTGNTPAWVLAVLPMCARMRLYTRTVTVR
jgi:hypothetical protein